MIHNLDRNKAIALVGEALEKQPDLRDQLARREANGQHWTLRAEPLAAYGETPGDVREYVLLSVVMAPGMSVALWHGPRELVSLDPEPRMVQ